MGDIDMVAKYVNLYREALAPIPCGRVAPQSCLVDSLFPESDGHCCFSQAAKKTHLRHPSSGWVPGALARRCDVRTKYASDPPPVGARASRAALYLDLFEEPGGKRVFQ
jgi:hypothetical protein